MHRGGRQAASPVVETTFRLREFGLIRESIPNVWELRELDQERLSHDPLRQRQSGGSQHRDEWRVRGQTIACLAVDWQLATANQQSSP